MYGLRPSRPGRSAQKKTAGETWVWNRLEIRTGFELHPTSSRTRKGGDPVATKPAESPSDRSKRPFVGVCFIGTIQDIKSRNEGSDPGEIQRIVGEAVAAVRAERRTKQNADKA